MKTWKKALALLLILALALSLAACGEGGSPVSESSINSTGEAVDDPIDSSNDSSIPASAASSEENSPAGTTPREETLYLVVGQWGTIINNNPFSSNPNSIFCSINTSTANELQYETLYMYNLLTGGADPLLADGEWSFDDQLNLTVKVKAAAAWNDGTPVTAEDVAATFNTHVLVNSNTGVAYAPYIESAEATDEHTVVFHPTQNVNVSMMTAYVTQNYVMQKAYLDSKLAEYGDAYDDFKNDTMYDAPHSGPYDLTINNAQSVGVTRRDSYWGQDASMWGKLPAPKYIVHNIYSDNNASANALRVGDADVGQNYVANVNTLWENEDLPISTYYMEQPYHIPVVQPTAVYNTTKKGLDQAVVRKAIAMAVDYDQILSSAETNQSAALAEYPRMLFQPNDAIRSTYVKDEAKLVQLGWEGKNYEAANMLLDDAGIVDTDGDGIREYEGQNLSFQCSCPTGWSDWQAAMQIVSDAGAKIGIALETYFPEAAQWAENLRTGNFDITMTSYGGGITDPWNSFYSAFYNYHGAAGYEANYPAEITMGYSRFAGESSTRANELLDLAAKTTDLENLKDYYQELNEIYLTEVPSFALMYRPQLWHMVSETVWTGFPSEGDGVSPLCCIYGQGVAALYHLELIG